MTPWTIAHQAPPSMGFPRQEYWRRLPLPSAGDLPNPEIEPMSPAWQADSLPLSHLGSLKLALSAAYRTAYCGSDGKESACNAGVVGSTPGSGRSPGEGNGNPLQDSCLGNPTDRRAWQATVHEVAELDN